MAKCDYSYLSQQMVTICIKNAYFSTKPKDLYFLATADFPIGKSYALSRTFHT